MDEQLDDLKDADRSLFPASFTIRALRDSRYHNTAYAIAELIDNSIEADALQIELLCMEQPHRVTSQMRRLVSAIAVLDNGVGMDLRTLLDASVTDPKPGRFVSTTVSISALGFPPTLGPRIARPAICE